MTWSYSGNPGASDLDQVRFLIQDTQTGRQLLTDEELQWLIDRQVPLYNDPIVAAIWAAEVIAARYIGNASAISADGVSVTVGALTDQYNALAEILRSQREDLQGIAPIPYAGGMDPAEDFMDGDVAPLSFGVGQWDNIRAGNQNYGRPGYPGYGNQLTEWS